MWGVRHGAPAPTFRPTEKKDTCPPAHLLLRHRTYQRPPSKTPNNGVKPAPSQGPLRPRDPTPLSPHLEHMTFMLSLTWGSTSPSGALHLLLSPL